MSTVRQHLGFLWLHRYALGVANPQYDRHWAMQAALFVETHLDELIGLAGGAEVEEWVNGHFTEIPAAFPSAPLPASCVEEALNLAYPTACRHFGEIEDRAIEMRGFRKGWDARQAPTEAPKEPRISDSDRLEWMMEKGAHIAWGKDGERCRVFARNEDGDNEPVMGWIPEAWAHCPREAIDAAIAQENAQ